jgi:hypothetical protein
MVRALLVAKFEDKLSSDGCFVYVTEGKVRPLATPRQLMGLQQTILKGVQAQIKGEGRITYY